jgi:hypothetical protein
LKSRLFSFASVLSLLVCSATTVLWVRSYSHDQYILLGSGTVNVPLLDATNGAIELRMVDALPGVPKRFSVRSLSPEFIVPLVVPVLLMAMLPIAVVTLRWAGRRRRLKLSLCLRCGYSLTGNTSGVCPECGTAVTGKAAT